MNGRQQGERIVILTFNDIYDLEPSADGTRAGFAALGGLIARERRMALDDPDDPAGAVVVCCCGDFLSAAPALCGNSPDDAGRHMVPLLDAIGVTHVVPGNHEFDRGTHPCALRTTESSFRWLCTNVRASAPTCGEDRPFGAGVDVDIVTTARGTRLGLFGLCTPNAPLLSAAGDGGAVFVDPVGALTASLPPANGGHCAPADEGGKLAANGLDVVVALTHMDLDDDVRLATSCADGVHLVVGGHDHEPIVYRTEGYPPIVKCGCDARWLGRIVLRVCGGSNGNAHRVSVESIDLLPNDATAVRDMHVERRIADLLADMQSRQKAHMASAYGAHCTADDKDDPLGRDPDAVLCKLPHGISSVGPREGPCPFANVVCDVLCDAAKVDLFLIHAGLLRRAHIYRAGRALTAGDVHVELPFPSRCAVCLVPGRRLVEALEHGIGAIGQPSAATGTVVRESRRLVHVSKPWWYTYDSARPGGERIVDVWHGDEPVRLDRIYRVGMPKYLTKGGDGFAALAGLDRDPSPATETLLCRLFVDGVTLDHFADAARINTPRIVAAARSDQFNAQ